MTSSNLDLRLMRYRSRGEEQPQALASALIEAGRSQDALEVIHLGLLGNEQDSELVTLEGRALYEQGELHEAQAALVRAAKANPASKEPYRWLAQVLIERGDSPRAVQVLQRAIAIDPHDGTLRQALARALRLSQAEVAQPTPRKGSAPRARGGVADAPPSPRTGAARLSALASGSARAANQNAIAVAPAVGRLPGAQEALAEARVAPAAEVRPAESASQSLPFEDEVERDDESPTTAAELPDGLRSWLRSEPLKEEQRWPEHGRGEADRERDTDEGRDDDESELTSIVPASAELELLRRQAQADAFRDDEADSAAERTIVVDDAQALEEIRGLAQPGEAEPPEQVLGLLEAQGVFEPSTQSPATWAERGEVQRSGMTITKALGLAWVVAMLAAVGGYYGFEAWLAKRRASAVGLVASAGVATLDGQYASLQAAEQQLLEARELDPKALSTLEALLFVQAAKALEGGTAELATVRETLAKARQAGLATPLVQLVGSLARPGPPDDALRDETLALAQREAGRDARVGYLGGKLALRAGRLALADELLAQAVAREPRMGLAHLARAEQARAEGQLEQAYEHLERALGSDRKQLRAELWLAMLDARPREEAALLRKLDGWKSRIARGSPGDQLLAAAVRAFAWLGQGDTTQARDVLQRAASLRVADAEPLAFFSEQALRAGETALAYGAARAASQAGGATPRYQSLLASVLLQQGDGDAALAALGDLGEGQALTRASAALLSDAREALERAKRELASYRATPAGKADSEATSLMLRVDLRLGANVESLLPAARALVRRAPESTSAHLALAEALVLAGQGPAALGALDPALRLAPNSAEVHYLVGAAQRLAGQPAESRTSLERAVAIAANHLQARRALGRALLDAGEFDAALATFQSLDEAGGDVAKLGAAEALLGQGKLEQAAARIAAFPARIAESLAGAVLKARLDIARGKPELAVEALAQRVEQRADTRVAEALVAYGDALYAAGQVDSAAQAYDDALELDGAHPDALVGRAGAALELGKADQASELSARAETALAQRARPPSTSARALMLSGRAALEKGQVVEAREHLEAALALTGAPAEAHFWYAEALTREPRAGGAREHYAKYRALAPTGEHVSEAKRALAATRP